MEYQRLVEVYLDLEKTTKRLEKIDIVSNFIKICNDTDLTKVIYLLQGKIFANSDERKLGMSNKLASKVISISAGVSLKEIESMFKKLGDLGTVYGELINNKKQRMLFSEPKKLSIEKVFANLQKVASLQGKGTVNKKVQYVSELLANANSNEARFILRTVVGDLRVGIASGIIRDAIAKAYNTDVKEIENAFNLVGDYSLVALKAKSGKLNEIKFKPGIPTNLMLAIALNTVEDGFKEIGDEMILDFKLDGFRCCIHKSEDKIRLFTRRLEDVTKQFPDVVEIIKNRVNAKEFIIDTEIIGYDPKTKKQVAFQNISQRIKRKYDIEKLVKDVPVEIYVFDILYLDRKDLREMKLSERIKFLDKIIKKEKNKIGVVDRIITSDPIKAKQFFKKALELGHEGVMIKNPDSGYKPGRYVKGWYKLKSVLEPLDLVIVKALWGQGKRANMLSSYTIACKDREKFVDVGKVSTGVKEKKEGLTYNEITKLLKPLIIETKGLEVQVKPKIIIEVEYEEIQKSPKYSSGYALRFPRVKFVRYDKSLKDINKLKEIIRIYKNQKK